MKQNYLGNGKTNLFVILANTSLVGHAKTLFVLLCLQFVCVAASAVTFTISASYDKVREVITVNYSKDRFGTATIKLFKLGDHYMNGNNATPLFTKSVNDDRGTVAISTCDLAVDAYVVNISGFGSSRTTNYFVVEKNNTSIRVENHPSAQNATITFGQSEYNVLKIKKYSNSQEVLSTKYSPCSFNYSNCAGGDYIISLYNHNSVVSQKSFSVHKITSLKREGNSVVVGYEKGTSSNGGYTVMRITALTSGKTYNEVPPCSDPESSGTVSIPVSDYYFKTDIYAISFVVDGVVCDTKKISLYFK